ncbi:MAG: hypothetical protein HQM16_10560 [Deltaproteobacteria bacterium]|nr:hypothetical protein [Deltaproteobacteria bacterium]
MMYDLVIIGSGFAGLAALKKAVAMGLATCLVYRDFGATQHFSGAFDVADPRLNNACIMPHEFPLIHAALDDFIRAHPGHLYSRIFSQKNITTGDLVGEMRGFFDFYGIPVVSDQHMVTVFGSTGAFKPTGFALKTQGLTVSDISRHQKAVFIHFPLIKDYHPQGIKAGLSKVFKEVRVVAAAGVPFNKATSLTVLLRYFDDAAHGLAGFRDFLKNTVQAGEIVFIPPVLGVKNTFTIHAELEKTLNTRVVEMLSGLPSSAGLRLEQIINRFFVTQFKESEKIKILKATVAGFTADGGKVLSVKTVSTHGTVDEVEGRSFILATGKYLGGGIAKDPCFKETVFNLPLFCDGRALNPNLPTTELISKDPLQRQLLFDVGVGTGPHSSPPAHYSQASVYENLKACGAVLSGAGCLSDGGGFGLGVLSALNAH